MKKRPVKAKDIVARSITITDSKGKARIYLGTLDNPAHSSICLFGERERAIELSTNPEGGLHINLRDGTGKLVVGLGITADDQIGLSFFDHRSGTITRLGSNNYENGEHHLSLVHHGKTCWTTRKKSPRVKKPG